MDPKLISETMALVESLRDDNEKLASDLAHVQNAYAIVFQMFKAGHVAAENLESTIKKFVQKDDSELEVIEKAASFGGAVASLGEVSDRLQDDGTMDPLTRMLVEDL
jgi:hypothetical protein